MSDERTEYDEQVADIIDHALDQLEEVLWNMVDDLEELILDEVDDLDEDEDDGDLDGEEGSLV